MSLVVWLPLNGNLNNQGLSDVTVTNSGATVDNSGKIGRCYTFTTSQYMELNNIPFTSLTNCSISFWAKITAKSSSGWLPFTGQSTSYYILATASGTGNFYHSTNNVGTSSKVYKDGIQTLVPGALNEWHHYIVTGLNLSTWTKFYINKYSSSWNFAGQINDVRIYDHCLSDKEVKEISKGLILHYKLDDEYVEPTNNLITSNDCLSNTCYNGAINKYNYGANSDMYKTTGEFEGKFCTKVYMGTSGNSAYPYVYVSNAFVSDGTNSPAYKTISFDFFGTIVPGNKIIPYKLGSGSGTCTWVNETLSESGSSASSANISVTPGIWNHIVMTLHGTSEADAQWGYIRIGTTSHTSDTANYWLFANMQMELKDHATPYVGVGGSREENIIYDVSGYGHDGTAVEPLEISNDTPRYKYCLTNINTYPLYSIFSIEEFENITISCWVKLTAWGKQTSGLWATSSSTTSPSDYTTTTCNHRDGGFDIRGTNGTTYRLSCTSSHIPLNTWKHVVFRHNGTTAQLFINGVATTNVNCPTKLVGFNAIFLGYSLAGGVVRQCQGSWSDFRIYVTALSDNDILELYHTAASVDNTGNLFAYQLNEV